MLKVRIAATLSALLFGAVAAGGAAWAGPSATLEFDGQISPVGKTTSDPFVAVYTYDPSTASSSTIGGDVTTTYDLIDATLSFGGDSYPVVTGVMDGAGYVIFDENAGSGYEIFQAVADSDPYNIYNVAEVSNGEVTAPYGSLFRVFNSNGSVTTYDMTVDRVSAAPEPAAWALMVGGVALAGAALRTRRRRSLPALASA